MFAIRGYDQWKCDTPPRYEGHDDPDPDDDGDDDDIDATPLEPRKE